MTILGADKKPVKPSGLHFWDGYRPHEGIDYRTEFTLNLDQDERHLRIATPFMRAERLATLEQALRYIRKHKTKKNPQQVKKDIRRIKALLVRYGWAELEAEDAKAGQPVAY